mgnify:CR=1 FL=1
MWQNHIKELIEQLFNYYKHEIEASDPAILEEFRKILENDTANYKSYKTVTTEIQQSKFGNIDKNLTIHSWEEIKPLLFKAVQKVEVKSINGTSGDCLTYYENEKTGISVIAMWMSIELCFVPCPLAIRIAQVTMKHFIAVFNDSGISLKVGLSSSFLCLCGTK